MYLIIVIASELFMWMNPFHYAVNELYYVIISIPL